jgi:hypothetical protein
MAWDEGGRTGLNRTPNPNKKVHCGRELHVGLAQEVKDERREQRIVEDEDSKDSRG